MTVMIYHENHYYHKKSSSFPLQSTEGKKEQKISSTEAYFSRLIRAKFSRKTVTRQVYGLTHLLLTLYTDQQHSYNTVSTLFNTKTVLIYVFIVY